VPSGVSKFAPRIGCWVYRSTVHSSPEVNLEGSNLALDLSVNSITAILWGIYYAVSKLILPFRRQYERSVRKGKKQ